MTTEQAMAVGRLRDQVADAVTDRFLSRHPDWIDRYGDRARIHGVKDARHHIDFLQAAVDLDDPRVFAHYALWCRDLLGYRGIRVEFLAEILEAIRDEFSGLLPLPATHAVGSALGAALAALSVPSELRAEGTDDRLSPAGELYLSAAISGRRKEALAVVQGTVAAGTPPSDVYVDIMQGALYEIGRRWQSTELTVAEEHMATATTLYILSALHADLPRTGATAGIAVVAGVVNESHVVGANMIANALETDGWDVKFLGTDLPHATLLAAIEQYRATLVAISMTMSRSISEGRDLIAQIRTSLQPSPRIIVGGWALRHDPELWRTLGADGYAADVRGLTELARA